MAMVLYILKAYNRIKAAVVLSIGFAWSHWGMGWDSLEPHHISRHHIRWAAENTNKQICHLPFHKMGLVSSPQKWTVLVRPHPQPQRPWAVGHLLKASFATTLANHDWALMRMTGLPWSLLLRLQGSMDARQPALSVEFKVPFNPESSKVLVLIFQIQPHTG